MQASQYPVSSSQASKQQIKVLFATPQCAPFVSVGGLGPIPLELGEALRDLPNYPKVDVRILLPYYQKGDYPSKEVGRDDRLVTGFREILATVETDVEDESGNRIIVSVYKTEVWTRVGPITVYAVRNDEVFKGNIFEHIPGPPLGGIDKAEKEAAKREAIKFAVFSSAVINLLKHPAWGKESEDWFPDVIHCHDWQTGLIPAYLDTLHSDPTQWRPHKPKTLFTFHFARRTGTQGVFHRDNSGLEADDLLRQSGWRTRGASDPVYDNGNPEWRNIRHDCLSSTWAREKLNWSELNDSVSFLKGGLAFSDMSNTVSEAYALSEMPRVPWSLGNETTIQGLISDGKWFGVANGFDYKRYDPNIDRYIQLPFNLKNYGLVKGRNKAALKEWMNRQLWWLAMDPPKEGKPKRDIDASRLDSPDFWSQGFIVGFDEFDLSEDCFLAVLPARIAWQKGIDITLEKVDQTFQGMPSLRIVVMGTGDYVDVRDQHIRKKIIYAAQNHLGRFLLIHWFDDAWERMLIAAADLFLMPSRFEPCGIAQQRAHHYGTPVLGSKVGGIRDTVEHLRRWDGSACKLVPQKADGFLFEFSYPALSPSQDYQNACRAFVDELKRAYECWERNQTCWNLLIENSMKRDHSWLGSVMKYWSIYARIRP